MIGVSLKNSDFIFNQPALPLPIVPQTFTLCKASFSEEYPCPPGQYSWTGKYSKSSEPSEKLGPEGKSNDYEMTCQSCPKGKIPLLLQSTAGTLAYCHQNYVSVIFLIKISPKFVVLR